ncbi:MAG: NAD(P)/FAD-dependent oxidoreductase [Desulfuromonadaceae bacterium]|nr:NAD(P)/FAD-dependent oxidoreductase [Desulfuromonadaceae bacterium]
MDEYQVIVVGSGPAGAACARALHEEGIKVLVVEKKALPRRKPCTAVVLGQARQLIEQYFGEAPPDNVLSNPARVQACDVVQWNREEGFSTNIMEIPKDGQSFPQEYLNAWRDKFDYWLLQKSGASFRDNCELIDFSEENGKYKVRLSESSKGDSHVYCSYLVAADGPDSRVKNVLEPSFAEQPSPILGNYQRYYWVADMGSLQDSICYVFRDRDFGDIMSIVHRKDDTLALCVGGLKGRNLKVCMKNLEAFLANEFRVVLGAMQWDEGCAIKIQPPYFGKDRVLIAGGAAGIIYLDGEGIAPAIDTGYKAGKAISRSIKEGCDALEEYQKELEPVVRHMELCMTQQHLFVQ